MIGLNVFRVLGDLSHILSKVILIWAIHSNKNASGISAPTQLLYILVFVTRYLDIFWAPIFHGLLLYNFVIKLFYILSSIYIIYLMYRVYPRSREIAESWRIGLYCLVFAATLCIPVTVLFEGVSVLSFSEIMWVFSIILESVCVLPQLILLCETAVPTVIDSYYLVALGSYRGWYIPNWIYRAATEKFFDPVSVIFGVVQTVLYIDFAIAYVRRQRVKLRPDGVLVDGQDLSSSLVVGRLIKLVGRPSLRTLNPEARSAAEADVERVAAAAAGGGGGGGGGGRNKKSGSGPGSGVAPWNDQWASERVGLTDPDEFDDDALVGGDEHPATATAKPGSGSGSAKGIAASSPDSGSAGSAAGAEARPGGKGKSVDLGQ